jgi:predicted PhzF superfamily epimerase YddE/YHI9
MPHRIRLIDAFVGPNARGNPAGVCLLEGPVEEAWMQAVAEEMNQAETAFCWPEEGERRLRWFTPMFEVDLCGHATLATAHALFSDDPSLAQAQFRTRSGPLVCRRDGDAILMDFPAQPCRELPVPDILRDLLEGKCEWYGEAGADYMAVLRSETEVREFQPDFGAIAQAGARGLLITARGREFDMVSRFFAPQYGIPEDAVTGSAHCALAPFWAERLGRTKLSAFQASRRGGVLELELLGDRVQLRGQARTTLDGTLL